VISSLTGYAGEGGPDGLDTATDPATDKPDVGPGCGGPGGVGDGCSEDVSEGGSVLCTIGY
jgi:hypothetical protein